MRPLRPFTRVTGNAWLAVRRVAALFAATRPLGYMGPTRTSNLGDQAVFLAARRLFGAHRLTPVDGASRERRLARLGLSGPRFYPSVVLGGGTLLNEYARGVVQELAGMGVVLDALGTGAGSGGWDHPVTVDYAAWRPLLARFRSIGVRGPRSRQALETVGVERVETVGDLALSLAAAGGARRERSIFFNVIEQGPGESWNPALLPALARWLQERVAQGWDIVPVPMDHSDAAPIARVLAQAGLRAGRVRRPRSPEEVLHLASRCSLAVSMRLHGAVLAVCTGTPALMLAYREKCHDFMDSVEATQAALDLDVPGDTHSLLEVLGQREQAALDVASRAHGYALRYAEGLRERAAQLLRLAAPEISYRDRSR